MIEVCATPLLAEFIKVCILLPQDERDQLEAFTGRPYDIDGAAIGAFCAPGPKWAIRADGEPIIVGGFAQERPGVWRDFLLTTPVAWEKHWFAVTRICRRIMTDMLHSGHAHRLECIAPIARLPRVSRWYSVLGYHQEGVLHGYCASGADAAIFSRVRHGN
ncbi:MAG: hypothetical protein KGL39_09770 [Patescibacteria group bacterium]|nr:hypothetical protein [Patescibacteria group bacterium]